MNEDLEQKKLELEVRLKEIEIQERLNTINSKKKISQSILIAILGGLLGILGSTFNNWFQHSNEREMERRKLNSTLIIKAIETNDKTKSIEALKFLLTLNLISDEGTLRDILYDSTKVNAVPATLQKILTITVTDSMNTTLSGLDVFCNHIYIGKTNLMGQATAAFSLDEAKGDEIEVKRNGIEYRYIDMSMDRNNNVTLRVAPPNE